MSNINQTPGQGSIRFLTDRSREEPSNSASPLSLLDVTIVTTSLLLIRKSQDFMLDYCGIMARGVSKRFLKQVPSPLTNNLYNSHLFTITTLLA